MYEIGQVVYALLEDKKILIPVKIIEEITVKNLSEEKTTYKGLIPNKKNQKVNLEKFSIVFKTTDDATEYLFNKAKNAIDDLVLETLELEESFFSTSKKITQESLDNIACKNDEDIVNIDMGDGTKARINMGNIKKYTPDINENNTEEKIEESTST